ncbi:MAG: SsrA-binding protein SmpB [Candidatus Kerfeldbacteria bacterium]|nr:SsrA-binding protein SmpB [Candidatus Kerfeldbacteria bacterium]
MPSYATNREAHHNYTILEKLEAGVVLSGAEVKSIKNGSVSLKGSYAAIHDGRLQLLNMHVGAYKPAGHVQRYDPTRTRSLLVHRTDIDRLIGKIHSAGLTLVPLSVYSKHGLIKIELGLARGKKAYDKRQSIKKKEVQRKIGRAMRVKA